MKKVLLPVIMFLLSIRLAAEEIYVAPFLFVDGGNEDYVLDQDFQEAFVKELNKKKSLLQVEIKKTNDKTEVRSRYDALSLCKRAKIAYLLYGWIKKTEYVYECEIRLFDGEGRKNIYTIYNKDEVGDREKFIENSSEKIIEKFRELFYVPEKDDIFTTLINVHTGIGYWLFTNKAWANHITGIIKLTNGFEIIPVDIVGYARKAKVCFSVGLDLDYLLGVGKKNSIPAYLNTLTTNLFTNTYFTIHDIHSVYLDFGLLYTLDIIHYKDMYDKAKINAFSGFGMNFAIGYKYLFTKKTGVILELNEELIFYSKVMSKFSGKLGFDFLVYNKEHLK